MVFSRITIGDGRPYDFYLLFTFTAVGIEIIKRQFRRATDVYMKYYKYIFFFFFL